MHNAPVRTPSPHLRLSNMSKVVPVCVCQVASVMSNSLQPYGLQPSRLLCPWDFPGKNTGVRCHFFLQGIFRNQGSNQHLLCLLHWQVDSFTTSATWEAHPRLQSFSRGAWWGRQSWATRVHLQGRTCLILWERCPASSL